MMSGKYLWIFIAVVFLVPIACGERPGRDGGETARIGEEEEQGHGGVPAEDASHEHGEHEVSDLDQPVEALFAATCEHGVKTYTCDECRYEVGVVKAPKGLFESGLLEVVKAEKRTAAVPLRLTGEVKFDERRVAHISTQVGGVIRRVHVTLGDRIVKGQALLEIESIEVGNAKAAYQVARATEALAKKNFERIEALREEGISSEKELIRARQELEAADIRVRAAKGTLRRIGTNGSSVRGITLDNSSGRLVVRAPSKGTVLKMHAVSGEVAAVGESLITIGDSESLWVWADLYEGDYARVASAHAARPLRAEVFVKAFPGRGFEGTVDFISPAMSESSRTIKVRIAVPNPDGALLAGMFADVDLFLPGGGEVLGLPKSAVLADEGRWFVFVHREGEYYVRRPVVPGLVLAGRVEIKSGLDGDERVVADGAFLLKSDVLRSKMGAGCAD